MDFQIKELIDELRTIIVQHKTKSKWLDIAEAVGYTSISESTIRRAVRKGELKVSKATGKLLFRVEWIDRWLSK